MTSVAPSPSHGARLRGWNKSSRARLALRFQALVEIGADRLHQHVDLSVEEMIGARNHLLLDHDALLGFELYHQAADVLVRYHGILVAMNDHARGRTRRQEGEIVEVGGRGNRDEPFNLGPA